MSRRLAQAHGRSVLGPVGHRRRCRECGTWFTLWLRLPKRPRGSKWHSCCAACLLTNEL